jgi:hypothetical protein
MPLATFATIQTQVQALVGANPAITLTDIGGIMTACNAEIVSSWTWSRRNVWTVVNTIVPVSLIVTATQGSSVVTGTGFAAGHVGDLIRISNLSTFYQIKSVTPGVSCVLGDMQGNVIVFPESTMANTSAQIFDYIYSLPSDCEIVLDVMYDSKLTEQDRSFFETLDPQRLGTADAPSGWCHFGRDSSQNLQIALFPVPSAAHSIRVNYQKIAEMSAPTDTPLYRADLLKWMSGETAAAFLLARTGDQAWSTLADKYHARYEEAFDTAKTDDLMKSSAPTAISSDEGMSLYSDDFLIAHDVLL